MARSPLILGLAALTSIAAVTVAAAQEAYINVPLNQTHRISVRGQAGSVIVGNPQIADVTVVDRNTLYVTGKGVGSTEVVVVDAIGRVLYQSQVEVNDSARGRVRVWRGAQATEMNCSSTCSATGASGAAPTPVPAMAGVN